MNVTCIRQLRYAEKHHPFVEEFFTKGPVDGDMHDNKTLDQIKDHADSNGDDPSTWDEKKTAVLAAKVDGEKTAATEVKAEDTLA